MPSLLERFDINPVNYPPEFAFWKKDAAFHYPNLLISMGLMNRGGFEKPEDVFVMGDSGGFQYGKRGSEHLTPKWVMQKQEENCTMGFILDRPPQYIGGGGYDNELFEKCLRITRENANIMQQVRTDDKFRLYGVIQGRNEEDWEKWYNTLTQDHDFDGWGIGSPTMGGAERIIRIMKWLNEMGLTKNIHMFGLLSEVFTAVLAHGAYLYGIENLTFDSSTKPMYVKPPQIPGIISRRGSANRDYKAEEFNEPFCICQVCEAYRNLEEYNEQVRTTYLIAHNIYTYLSQFSWVNALANDYNDLKDVFRGSKEYLDMYYEEKVVYEDEKQQRLF